MDHHASSSMRRFALLGAFCLMAFFAFAGVAGARTLTVSGTSLTYAADPGDINFVSVTYTGTDSFVLVDDGVDAISLGTGAANCDTNSAPNEVDCTGSYTSLTVNLGDQDDGLDASGVTDATLAVTANGDAGFEELTGGAGDDTLNGGDDGDDLWSTPGNDTINGGAGNDYMDQGSGATDDGDDTIDGGTGTDFIDYYARDNGVTVDLTGGVDSLGATTNNGQPGENDNIKNVDGAGGSSTGPNTLTGNSGPNDLYGGADIDAIDGNAGDDYMPGDLGADTLNGGAGSDFLDGGPDADVLNGGDDSDYLYGGRGAGDELNGGPGDDELDGGTDLTNPTPASDGADTLDGGPGSDWVDYYDRTAPVTVDLSGGGDGSTATTHNGQGTEGDSITNIENVDAGSGGDTITGNSQSNTIYDEGGSGDNISTLDGDDEIDARDGQVDNADCGGGSDHAFVDVAGEFGDPVSDNVSNCEAVNSDFTPPPVDNPPPVTTPPVTNTTPPVTNPTPPPIVITANAFVARKQTSPKADTVFGSANIPADGTTLKVQLLYSGKLAKVTVVGKLTKTGLKKGTVPFKVKLGKKAAKLARKKGKKGLRLTVKVTIKPPTGSATVKQFKVTVKKGKAPACYRISRYVAHAAC